MKVAHRGGHNYLSKGAVALIDEVIEDRKVNEALGKYLTMMGVSHLDVTPNSCDTNTDLAYGVNRANNWGADLFVSIHFNKAYNSYNGAIGTEVCVYSNMEEAQRVVDSLSNLGFVNRGQKIRTGLYELNNTYMKAMIVEVCFCEATEDVALYNRLGADLIGKAIAEAITGKKVKVPNATISKAEVLGNPIVGNQLTFKGTGNNGALYRFYIRRGNGEWIKCNDYSTSNTLKWTFTTPDNYRLSIHVKNKNSNNDYDNYEYVDFTIKEVEKSKITSFTVEGKQKVNSPLKFKTIAINNAEYEYWIYDVEANEWMRMVDYGYYTEFNHIFTSKKQFKVVVHVRNKCGKNDYDDYAVIELDLRDKDHEECEGKIEALEKENDLLEEEKAKLEAEIKRLKDKIDKAKEELE